MFSRRFLKTEWLSWKCWLWTRLNKSSQLLLRTNQSRGFVPDSVQSWAARCRCGTGRWAAWWWWRWGDPRSCSSPPTETPKSAKQALLRNLQDKQVRLEQKSSWRISRAKKSSLPVWTYRQQRLNVLLQEGGDVLPVQDVSQPAVLPLRCHLVAGPTSGVGHVLQQRQRFLITTQWWQFQGIRFLLAGNYLDEPGVVQSVPELQHLLFNHIGVVHLVPQHLVELRGHEKTLLCTWHPPPKKVQSVSTQIFTLS